MLVPAVCAAKPQTRRRPRTRRTALKAGDCSINRPAPPRRTSRTRTAPDSRFPGPPGFRGASHGMQGSPIEQHSRRRQHPQSRPEEHKIDRLPSTNPETASELTLRYLTSNSSSESPGRFVVEVGESGAMCKGSMLSGKLCPPGVLLLNGGYGVLLTVMPGSFSNRPRRSPYFRMNLPSGSNLFPSVNFPSGCFRRILRAGCALRLLLHKPQPAMVRRQAEEQARFGCLLESKKRTAQRRRVQSRGGKAYEHPADPTGQKDADAHVDRFLKLYLDLGQGIGGRRAAGPR